MASTSKRLELICFICNQSLTSYQDCLPEEAMAIIADQNAFMKIRPDGENKYSDIDQNQVIATKCGHMFHIGCVRQHIKLSMSRKTSASCPICRKPVILTRVWPILIPPTAAQAARTRKMADLKRHNEVLKTELADTRQEIQKLQKQLTVIEKETSTCLEDIKKKQMLLDHLNGPSEEELDELRKIHKRRQSIVRVVTKHNAELLGVLM